MSPPLLSNIVQVGVVVRSVDDTLDEYRRLLNLTDWNINYVDTKKGRGSNFRHGDKAIAAKAKIAWINIGNVELELIEPQDEESVYACFLREKGPGIHHLMFTTPDYARCIERMEANQVAVLGGGELQQTEFLMFDTEYALGVVCEIAKGDPLIPDESV